MQYLHDDRALMIFYHEDTKWTMYFFQITISMLVMSLSLYKLISFIQSLQSKQNGLSSNFFLQTFPQFHESLLFIHIIFWLVCCFTFFSFVLLRVKFTMLLLDRAFSNTSILKHMSFPFQINIVNNILENDMDLEDDVLFNFAGVTSQLMRDNNTTP